MPEYLAPGVYVEEIATGPVPIEGVSTSTAGFVGYTERGPVEPRLVTGWLEFQRWFGGLVDPDTLGSFLPYAVNGFFDNGGRRAYIARIERANSNRSAAQLAGATLQAIGPGLLDNRIYIRIDDPSRRVVVAGTPVPDPDRFKLTVILLPEAVAPGDFIDPFDPTEAANRARVEPEMIEVYDDLQVGDGQGDSIQTRILSSQLVSLNGTLNQRPNNSGPNWTPLTQGADGDAPQALQYAGSEATPTDPGRGLGALRGIDEIAILSVPDEGHPALDAATRTGIQNAVVLQCQDLRDRFAVLQFVQNPGNLGQLEPPTVSEYAAIYHPWLRVADPANGQTHLVPPGGHVVGIYANTDIQRGVHKAPANAVVQGIVNANLPGNRFPVSTIVSRRQQDILNPKGINIIRDFRADRRGIRVWVPRTLADNSQWRYVNVRRLFIFVEESIDEGTQWVVFEPNDEPTWARVRRSVAGFLDSVWRSGALMGTTQEEAFFVRCDRTTMSPDDIDNGRLICYVGLAPVKPAEFVIFRFSQKTIEATATA